MFCFLSLLLHHNTFLKFKITCRVQLINPTYYYKCININKPVICLTAKTAVEAAGIENKSKPSDLTELTIKYLNACSCSQKNKSLASSVIIKVKRKCSSKTS